MRARLLPAGRLDADQVGRWQSLAAAAVEPNPFFEPLAVQPALELLPGGADVLLLVVEDDAQWQLALPVLRRRGRLGIPLKTLQGWDHPYSFLGTPLARAEGLPHVWSAVLEGDLGVRWLSLDHCALDGPVVAALERTLSTHGLKTQTSRAFERPVLNRRPAPDYLDGRVSSRHRKTLRRQERRLAEGLGGELELVDHASDGPGDRLDVGIELLLAQERAGWKGRAGTAMACRDDDAELFRRWCRAFAAAGRLELWSLQGPAGSAATQSNVRAGQTIFHFKIAYDETWRSYSPGLQVELAMVDTFHHDHRLQHIDSGGETDDSVSGHLYPDRARLGTVLVPLDRRGQLAVTAGHRSAALRRRAGELRRRLPARVPAGAPGAAAGGEAS